MKQLILVLIAVLVGMTISTTSFAKSDVFEDVNEPVSDFSLLFNMNNIFRNTEFFSAYQGVGGGLMMSLSEKMALRFTLDFTRTAGLEKRGTTTYYQGSEVVNVDKSFNDAGSSNVLDLAADFLYFFSEGKVNPYTGGGLLVDWQLDTLKYTDDSNDFYDEIVDNKTNTLMLGLEALFGIQWNVKPRISLFLEYGLTINVFETYKRTDSTITQDKVGNTSAQNEEYTVRTGQSWFNMNLGLTHGGALGISINI
jgi:hypothetical protein